MRNFAKVYNHKQFLAAIKQFSIAKNWNIEDSVHYEDDESPYSKGYAKEGSEIIIKFTYEKKVWRWGWGWGNN